jgi:hypothetical protein
LKPTKAALRAWHRHSNEVDTKPLDKIGFLYNTFSAGRGRFGRWAKRDRKVGIRHPIGLLFGGDSHRSKFSPNKKHVIFVTFL